MWWSLWTHWNWYVSSISALVKVSRESIGAISIMSTLAVDTLPRPQSPPANQAERLAATIQPVVAFMVLCSILIHGLSIPFFSLGRRVTTVTRTWSRQPSLHQIPDWALHTRRVERPEDVQINHDPESTMERGQVSDNEKDVEKRHRSETTGFDEDEKGVRTLQRDDSAEADSLTIAITETEVAKPDNPPDGTDSYEWKEGPFAPSIGAPALAERCVSRSTCVSRSMCSTLMMLTDDVL